jgi:transcriptional regulator with PAS, ATPase and Fis domain
MVSTPCRTPFERGANLCGVCRMSGREGCSRLVAESRSMRALLRHAAIIAGSDAPVVILGETGTGKDVLARVIHANSPRRAGPYVAVNVAALPADLLESELFGHARGSFTGAVAEKVGLFEAAHGGTLLLDEIGELAPALQAKLLRVLQDGEIRRVGANEPYRVDVRVLCATNRDLRAAVAAGTFRDDLYWRLDVFTLSLPPLRERPEDILPLAVRFLADEQHPGRFTDRAIAALRAGLWPGNVRQLQNAVKHGAVLSRGADVDVEHLPASLGDHVAPPALTLDAAVRAHVARVLEGCGGNQVEAARILGIGRTTLWRHLKESR